MADFKMLAHDDNGSFLQYLTKSPFKGGTQFHQQTSFNKSPSNFSYTNNNNNSARNNNTSPNQNPLKVEDLEKSRSPSSIHLTESTTSESPLKPVEAAPPTRTRTCCIIASVITVFLIVAVVVFCILYFGFKIFDQSPKYNELCSSEKPCQSGQNLICSTTCKCQSGFYWDGFKCTPSLGFGSACYGGTFQCISGLSCVNTLCQCDSISFYNGTNCEPKRTFASPCATCSYSSCPTCNTCLQCLESANYYCDTVTSTCKCAVATHYYDSLLKACMPKVNFKVYCSQSDMCKDVSAGLMCQLSTYGGTCPTQPALNFCNCPVGKYFNTTHCVPLESYYGTCNVGCECDGGKLLYCDSTVKRCICYSGYYWSGVQCLPMKGYLASCTAIRECDPGLGLTCQANLCKCSLFSSNWYWSVRAGKCAECPFGWTVITFGTVQRCIKFEYSLLSWGNAKFNCESMQANLLVVDDATEAAVIKAIPGLPAYSFWVGANDQRTEGSYVWAYTLTSLNTAIVPFCSGYPQASTFINCILLNTPGWCYQDNTCESLLFSICQKD